MSEHVAKCHNFQEIDKGNENSYHSVWMAHWTRTDSDATEQRLAAVEKENNGRHRHGLNQIQIVSDITGPSKDIEQVKTSTTLEIMKESVRGGDLKNEKPGFQPLPVNGSCRSGPSLSRLKTNKETRGSQSSQSFSKLHEGKEMRGLQELTPLVDRVALTHEGERRTTNSCLPKSVASATEISCGQSKSQKSMEKINTRAFFSDRSYVETEPLQDISGSESGIILYRSGCGKQIFEFGRSGMSSYKGSHFEHANDQLSNVEVKQSVTEPYHCSIRSQSLLGTSMKNHTSSRKKSTPYHRLGSLENPSSSVVNRTSVSRDYDPAMHNFPSFRQLQFPSHGCSPELTKLEKYHDAYSSMRKLPPPVPKVETLRIGADVDSVAGSSGCFPIFSHSNRSMLISEKTEVRFGKEDVIKNVRVSSNIDVNAYLSSSSPFLHHGQQGIKIQSLCSSTDSEGNKYHEDSKDSEGNLKNASSAETDAMDIDAFSERCHTSGINQSSFMKALNSNTMQLSGDRPRTEIRNSQINRELPDTNLELSAANNKIEGAVSSFSKTQSLDMDMLLAYPARTNNSISSPSLNILMKADPTRRWAKRLKSSALDTQGVGTHSFDLEDVSRNKMMKSPSDMCTLELLGGNHKLKPTEADKTAFEMKTVASSKVTRKRGKDLLLSQSWIQRWLRNEGGTGEKKSEALVVCDPQSSKLVLDDLQKKQFPSIAAMALMGKAMNGFRPCELQNRGPFVVWN